MDDTISDQLVREVTRDGSRSLLTHIWLTGCLVFTGLLILAVGVNLRQLIYLESNLTISAVLTVLLNLSCAIVLATGRKMTARHVGIALLITFLAYGLYEQVNGGHCDCLGPATKSINLMAVDMVLLVCFLFFGREVCDDSSFSSTHFWTAGIIVLTILPILIDLRPTSPLTREVWTEDTMFGRSIEELLPATNGRYSSYSGKLYVLDRGCAKCTELLDKLMTSPDTNLVLLFWRNGTTELIQTPDLAAQPIR